MKLGVRPRSKFVGTCGWNSAGLPARCVQRGMLPLAEPDAFRSIHNGHQRVFRQSERPPARRSCRLATELMESLRAEQGYRFAQLHQCLQLFFLF
jgi:hypothetical protein